MKNCKKLLSVVLILVILLSAAGCTVIRTEEKSGGRTEPSGEVSPPEAEPEPSLKQSLWTTNPLKHRIQFHLKILFPKRTGTL